jgi:uncharacterized protein YuzE
MRISYDKAADALYIQLTANPPRDSMDIEDGVTADLDDQGHVVGLEVLDAHARLGREAMAHLRIEWLAGGDVLKVEDGQLKFD